MSYILDALKKSEQQRGRGAIPNVQTVHSSSLNYRDEKRAYWPYILITAVILNLIAIVYFIFDKDDISDNSTLSIQHTTIDNNAKKTIAMENSQTLASEQSVLSEKPIMYKKQSGNTISTGTEIKPAEIQPGTTKATLPIAVTAIKNTGSISIITPDSSSKASVNKQPVQPQKDIISFYDLPTSIQQQLPAIIVTAHIYSSNPIQRSMVINNNFMEEGEYVIDDLILHEITADGAVFDYAETRFHYSVVSGWQ
jgi:general secretion pathway protein B